MAITNGIRNSDIIVEVTKAKKENNSDNISSYLIQVCIRIMGKVTRDQEIKEWMSSAEERDAVGEKTQSKKDKRPFPKAFII